MKFIDTDGTWTIKFLYCETAFTNRVDDHQSIALSVTKQAVGLRVPTPQESRLSLDAVRRVFALIAKARSWDH